jgi:hypothetical protein
MADDPGALMRISRWLLIGCLLCAAALTGCGPRLDVEQLHGTWYAEDGAQYVFDENGDFTMLTSVDTEYYGSWQLRGDDLDLSIQGPGAGPTTWTEAIVLLTGTELALVHEDGGSRQDLRRNPP